jgi:hypothetical protein
MLVVCEGEATLKKNEIEIYLALFDCSAHLLNIFMR